jgi:siroheme synthase
MTGHHAASDEFADWPAKIPTDATVVVYMPGYDYRSTAQQLERAGVAGTTPCAIVSQATSPTEQIHLTTVQELHTSPRLPSPTLLVVGEVVRLAKPAALHQQFAWPGDAPGSGASLRLHSDFASNGAASFGAQERAE